MTRIRKHALRVPLFLVATAGAGAAVRHAAADAPAGRYQSQNGTVLDTKTGLVWQQGVPGPSYTWSEATTYCTGNEAGLPGTNWRLPSMKELQTLVDESATDPAIDLQTFPSTPPHNFWTSSQLANSPSQAWVVYFYQGSATFAAVTDPCRVRCVR